MRNEARDADHEPDVRPLGLAHSPKQMSVRALLKLLGCWENKRTLTNEAPTRSAKRGKCSREAAMMRDLQPSCQFPRAGGILSLLHAIVGIENRG